MTDPFRGRVRDLWAAYHAATAEAKAELDRCLRSAAEPLGVAPLYDLAEQPQEPESLKKAKRKARGK